MSTDGAAKPEVVEERAIDPVADAAGPEAARYEQDLANDTGGAADDAPILGRQPIRSQVDRAEIGDRFAQRRQDAEAQIGFTGTHADLTTLAGKLTQEQPDEPAEGQGDPPAAAQDDTTGARASGPSDSKDKTFTLTVFDEPMEVSAHKLAELSGLTVEDVLAAPDRATRIAQMDIAASRRLEAAKNRTADQPTSGRRDATEGQNQPGRTAEPADDEAALQNQEDESRQLAERIQFGTTDEAAEAIRSLKTPKIDADAVRQVMYAEKHNADLETSTDAYKGFVKENEDLFKNPLTRGALTEAFHDGLRKDLKDLGYNDDRIPKTIPELRDLHRFHRVNGKKVRDTATLLADSKQAVETWKSGSLNPAPRQPGTVHVNVDRTERRQAIPQQPARAAVPPQAVTSPAKTQSVRSEAIGDILGKRRRVVIT